MNLTYLERKVNFILRLLQFKIASGVIIIIIIGIKNRVGVIPGPTKQKITKIMKVEKYVSKFDKTKYDI